MTDPRAENCKASKIVNGLIMGVELAYVPNPSLKYELIRCGLIDEPTNGVGGPTVASCVVLDKDNIQTTERVFLAWPWPGMKDGHGLPGNPGGQHMISNKYNADKGEKGPLGLYVGDANAVPISDLIGQVGLPNGHHVSYHFIWKERGAAPIEPVPEPGGIDLTVTNALLQKQLDILKAIAIQFRVPGY